MNTVSAFAAALLDPAAPCPPGLRAWNGSDPAGRLAVYRNNVTVSLVDALAQTFPVAQRFVGDAFFRAMATVFVRGHPPRSPLLVHYGDRFADFVADFEPAASLPCLPDLCRLEFARVRAYHAADAEPVEAAVVAAALARPQALVQARLRWHASLQALDSAHAVATLWAAHQGDGEPGPLELDRPESALVLRDGADVLVRPVGRGTSAFVRATGCFGDAVARALAAEASFDVAVTLSLLIGHGALVALELP